MSAGNGPIGSSITMTTSRPEGCLAKEFLDHIVLGRSYHNQNTDQGVKHHIAVMMYSLECCQRVNVLHKKHKFYIALAAYFIINYSIYLSFTGSGMVSTVKGN